MCNPLQLEYVLITCCCSLLEEPDYPEVSRVMRVKPRPDERPAAGFSWGDYEDVDSDGANKVVGELQNLVAKPDFVGSQIEGKESLLLLNGSMGATQQS